MMNVIKYGIMVDFRFNDLMFDMYDVSSDIYNQICMVFKFWTGWSSGHSHYDENGRTLDEIREKDPSFQEWLIKSSTYKLCFVDDIIEIRHPEKENNLFDDDLDKVYCQVTFGKDQKPIHQVRNGYSKIHNYFFEIDYNCQKRLLTILVNHINSTLNYELQMNPKVSNTKSRTFIPIFLINSPFLIKFKRFNKYKLNFESFRSNIGYSSEYILCKNDRQLDVEDLFDLNQMKEYIGCICNYETHLDKIFICGPTKILAIVTPYLKSKTFSVESFDKSITEMMECFFKDIETHHNRKVISFFISFPNIQPKYNECIIN